MGRRHVVDKLTKDFGVNWPQELRDALNRSPQYITAAQLAIHPRTLSTAIQAANISHQNVYTLPGDVIVIKRDGKEIVVPSTE